ncbi:hypothetical protein HanPSC8_Chr08g0341001 [Helianthus annuus]|nr:hypothetical protein HanIR_Chr08g0380851 [Helianthus annuus]KAJ0902768.1 hypothetical protein HanPSC8_Chr08g0341001 [Helianthus annuus]
MFVSKVALDKDQASKMAKRFMPDSKLISIRGEQVEEIKGEVTPKHTELLHFEE